MLRQATAGLIGMLATAGAAMAQAPILQMDLNGLGIQALNAAGAPSPFSGTGHTGSIQFSFVAGTTDLISIGIAQTVGGPFIDQGYNGTLTSLSGSLILSNGLVTGGGLNVGVNGNTLDPDSYTTQVVPNSGSVSTFVGGGFKIEGLTFNGVFDDPMFANVNVSQFIGSLNGSFLQFNFSPNATGGGFADVDLFVVAPAPGGLALLAGAGLFAARRRRR